MSLPLGKYNSFSQESTSIKKFLARMHIDAPLLLLLLATMSAGLVILYSASQQSLTVTLSQVARIVAGLVLMWLIAMVSPSTLKRWTPRIFFIFLIPLILVLMGDFGVKVKGAARWLDFGLFRFQPSEVYKIAVPMMLAWLLADARLPIRIGHLILALIIIAIPLVLIAIQPDLGTAIMVAASGLVAIFLAGLKWRLILLALIIIGGSAVPIWNSDLIKPYQKKRILTLFVDNETDCKEANYQSCQSAIAIGSGGVYGKGYLNGTQTKHGFLPEKHTDFIFAVISEEFGLVGALFTLMLYLLVLFRGLLIATGAQDTYSRLLAGTLVFMFMINMCINILMVQSLLPVVGLPLPLLSYGGTSVVTLLAGFGMLMSIQTHRKLI